MKCSLCRQLSLFIWEILYLCLSHSLNDNWFPESGKTILRQAAEARKEQSNFYCEYSCTVSADFPLSVPHVMPLYACYSIYTYSICELCMLHVGIDRSSRKSERSKRGFKDGENERQHTIFLRQQDKGRQDF